MALQHIHTDLGLLELRAYDGVLGIDWLDFFSPMNCDWCGKVISFDYQGKWVTLQGVMKEIGSSLEHVFVSAFLHLRASPLASLPNGGERKRF
jgi:hypothetical protein